MNIEKRNLMNYPHNYMIGSKNAGKSKNKSQKRQKISKVSKGRNDLTAAGDPQDHIKRSTFDSIRQIRKLKNSQSALYNKRHNAQ